MHECDCDCVCDNYAKHLEVEIEAEAHHLSELRRLRQRRTQRHGIQTLQNVIHHEDQHVPHQHEQQQHQPHPPQEQPEQRQERPLAHVHAGHVAKRPRLLHVPEASNRRPSAPYRRPHHPPD